MFCNGRCTGPPVESVESATGIAFGGASVGWFGAGGAGDTLGGAAVVVVVDGADGGAGSVVLVTAGAATVVVVVDAGAAVVVVVVVCGGAPFLMKITVTQSSEPSLATPMPT